MRLHVVHLFAAALLVMACDKSSETSNPPPDDGSATAKAEGGENAEQSASEADGAGEGEAKAEPDEKKDYFVAATFNLAWAHDDFGDGTKQAELNRAKDAEAWKWKAQGIAKVLAESKPDIVALHELGGDGEVHDLLAAIEELGGPEYKWGYQASDDPRNGHNSAILSVFPVTNERRFDIHLRRHMAVDVELPTGDVITVVAVHAPEGNRPNAVKARRNQVEALVREINQIREENPVIVLSTLGSNIIPTDEEYEKSAAGMFASSGTYQDDDDCADSGDMVLETTTSGEVADRIFVCDLVMRDASAEGRTTIIREAVDKWDKPWSQVPVDKDPHRDISDHLLLVAEIELPKPPPEDKEGEGEGEDKADE
jgi:endonuclease/exonuclease/phosphatase family metal-dependent hydrolase